MATTNTMSKIKFTLEALVNTISARATKGILMIVLDDKNVQGLYTYKKLKKVTENWEVANKAYIAKAFSDYGVKQVMVASKHEGADNTVAGKDNIGNSLDDALALFNNVYENGWMVAPQVTIDADKKKFVDFIKSQRNDSDFPLKGVVYNYSPDTEAVVNFTGKDLTNTINGTKTPIASEDYLIDVASVLCILGANESITNKTAKNVTECDIKSDADDCVSKGELFLYNNGTSVVFSRGVNSKQTFSTTESNALSKIRVVEVIDMVKSDLREIFNNSYIGKYGNSYSNRKTLVFNLNKYLKGIAKEGYLSNDETSTCELDIEATKIYLESLGTNTDDMKDSDILKAKIDTHVFVKSTIYVMDTIEDINFVLQYEV